MTLPLQDVLAGLYRHEINVSLVSFYDAGVVARIGDDWNGFTAERTFGRDQLGEIAGWLRAEAVRLYPKVPFACADMAT
jgi:hypothetical protein